MSNIMQYVAKENSINQSSTRPPRTHSSLPPSPGVSRAGRGHPPEEDVAALFADVGPEPQELAVDPMQDGLEVLALPGVLAIKQLQELWDPGSGG